MGEGNTMSVVSRELYLTHVTFFLPSGSNDELLTNYTTCHGFYFDLEESAAYRCSDTKMRV